MTKIEFLTKVLENANGNMENIVGPLSCLYCPLRAECSKFEDEQEDEELSCEEWLNRVLTD